MLAHLIRIPARIAGVVGLTALLLVPATALAVSLDACNLFGNAGFENGNLNGWSVTRPNTNYVASLSPPVNPSIDPADPANNPATLGPAAGAYFTGLKRVGDTGPDLSYKLAHDAIPIDVPTGTTFEVRVWANRGRLEPFDTPGSTGEVTVRIFGWIAGAQPTVTPSTDNWSRTVSWNPAVQSFDFTAVPDGTWGSQTFAFDPAAAGVNAATLKWLAIAVTGQNHNHDQYVAIDLCDGPTRARTSTWGSIKLLWR